MRLELYVLEQGNLLFILDDEPALPEEDVRLASEEISPNSTENLSRLRRRM